MWVDFGELPTEGAVANWAMRPYWRGWAGGAANPDLWQTTNFETGDIPPPVDIGYDVIVWFQTISPTRLLPVADPPAPSAP
jgi:erythromycin esterase